MRASLLAVVGFALCLLGTPGLARAQAVLPSGFEDELIAGGLNYSCGMDFLPDLRVVIVEKYDARVRLVVNGVLVPTPVAVIDSIRQSSEAGLLGIAVDPAWPAKPYLYFHYNYLGSRSIRIARYTAVGDVAWTGNGEFTLDLGSRHLVLADLPDRIELHNGGGVRFGPDGMLYVSLGDDLDPCFSPLRYRLQGKILRLDVSSLPAGAGGPASYASLTPFDNPYVGDPDPAARLVWARGLRNPYSFQVDHATGDLMIADVGGAFWEELDYQDQPGMNFGWPRHEGPVLEPQIVCPTDSAGSTPPVYAYDRTDFQQGAAIITSPRYRRPAVGEYRFPAEYEGDVFVSDVGEGIFRRIKQTGASWDLAPPVPGQPSAVEWGAGMVGVTDYHLHPDGSLWYLKYAHFFNGFTGQVRRIVFDNSLLDAPEPTAETHVTFAAPYPSPAVSRATFAFRTARAGGASLAIYDAAGREVRRVLHESSLDAGSHSRTWNLIDAEGRRVAPGVYLAVLESEGRRLTRRLPVLR